MNNITPYPVLAHVVNMIENVISGIKIQYTAEGVVTQKDGNDTIHLEQKNDGAGNFATIFIKDPRDILFSEDLFPSLKNLHQGTSGDLKLELQNTKVIINDLDVETQIILEEAKDEFDQIINSYEFVKTIEKEGNKLKSSLKFGNNSFILSLINDADQILVSTEFASSLDATVRKTIESDTLKVQEELNASFK